MSPHIYVLAQNPTTASSFLVTKFFGFLITTSQEKQGLKKLQKRVKGQGSYFMFIYFKKWAKNIKPNGRRIYPVTLKQVSK